MKTYTKEDLFAAIEQHRGLFAELMEAQFNYEYGEYLEHVKAVSGTAAEFGEWQLVDNDKQAFNVFVDKGLGFRAKEFMELYKGEFESGGQFVQFLSSVDDQFQVEFTEDGAEHYWQATLRNEYHFIDGFVFAKK